MANIDYGMGQTNIDKYTGIRYGVISQHSMGDGFYDVWEADYGNPTCPKCGNDAIAYDSAEHDEDIFPHESADHECRDYICLECAYAFGSESAFPDEPIGHSLDTDGYKAIDCLDSDVMLIASPYYTYASFCSPCVPGAGNLDDAIPPMTAGESIEDMRPTGVKTYCFSHDWFESGKAPYRVFRVSDDTEVMPE